jgi:hypothetical protein
MNQNWKEERMSVTEKPDVYDGNIRAAFEREQLRAC